VLRRRIERAKQLLRDTELPVLQVALRTGFASQSHLSTAFKRATGSTPGAYRR
jgi:AraC family transcriptional regulator